MEHHDQLTQVSIEQVSLPPHDQQLDHRTDACTVCEHNQHRHTRTNELVKYDLQELVDDHEVGCQNDVVAANVQIDR